MSSDATTSLVHEDTAHEDGSEASDQDPLLQRLRDVKPNRSSTSLLLYAGPALLLCTFAVGFDISFISANYSRRIASALNEFQNASWIVLGFTVTESCLQPLYGHASQIYGKRKAILVAAMAMTVGFLLCTLSFQLWELALSRVVVGIGSAGLQFLVVMIINDLVELYNLALWKSIVVFVRTCALILGGPAGAKMIDEFGFRPAFGIQFSLMAAALIALFFTLRLPNPPSAKTSDRTIKIDYVGAALLLLSVATPLFAINLGGDLLPWSSPVVILLLCLTPIFIAVFCRYETRVAVTSIVPMKYARMPAVLAVFVYGLPVNFAFDQLLFSFGTYLEARSLKSATFGFSDWSLPCIFLGQPIGNLLGGIVIRRYHKFKLLMQVNVFFNIVLFVLFAVGVIEPEKPEFAPFLILVGINNGISESCWLVALLSLADHEDQPQLYAFYDLGLSISGDLGIAISLATTNALVRSKLHTRLDDHPEYAEVIRKSLESFDYVRKLPHALQEIVLDAFISSTEKAFAISSVVLLISILGAFFLREMPQPGRVSQ